MDKSGYRVLCREATPLAEPALTRFVSPSGVLWYSEVMVEIKDRGYDGEVPLSVQSQRDCNALGHRGQCYFCEREACSCDDAYPGEFVGADPPADLDTFLFEGVAVYDPKWDVSGRFYVDPVVYYGKVFVEWAKKKGMKHT